MKKSWLDNGFRTWWHTEQGGKFHWFWYRHDVENYQGDICKRWTLHLAGRAFQYTLWQY